jgi:hypothetical protein
MTIVEFIKEILNNDDIRKDFINNPEKTLYDYCVKHVPENTLSSRIDQPFIIQGGYRP